MNIYMAPKRRGETSTQQPPRPPPRQSPQPPPRSPTNAEYVNIRWQLDFNEVLLHMDTVVKNIKLLSILTRLNNNSNRDVLFQKLNKQYDNLNAKLIRIQSSNPRITSEERNRARDLRRLYGYAYADFEMQPMRI